VVSENTNPVITAHLYWANANATAQQFFHSNLQPQQRPHIPHPTIFLTNEGAAINATADKKMTFPAIGKHMAAFSSVA